MPSKSKSRVLTNHGEIRDWAESRGATPTCVRGTGGGEDLGMIRLDFPGYSGEQSLQEVSWDEWLQNFDENNLALLVQDEMANGQQSNFNKLISRDTASERRSVSRSSRGGPQRAERRSAGRRGSRSSSSSRTSRGRAKTRRGSKKRASAKAQRSTTGKKRPAMGARGRSTRSTPGRSSGSSGKRAA